MNDIGVELKNMYCVFSDMSVKELGLLLNCFKLEHETIDFMKVLYNSKGHDTNRTLIRCSETLYERLIQMGFGKRIQKPLTKYYKKPHGFENQYYFYIEPFQIPEESLDLLRHRLIIHTIPLETNCEVPVCYFYHELQTLLLQFVEWGWMKPYTWWILSTTPMTFFEMGQNQWRQEDYMTIYFHQSVSKSVLFLLKTIMDKRFVYSHCIRCSFCY